MLKVLIICLCFIYGFLYFIFAVATKKPFKTIFFYGFLGLAGLIVIDLTSNFSGIYIPVNPYTIGASTALGLPGTITLLLLRMIFI